MDLREETECSYIDDEVFFGRLTLKEVKKRIFMDIHQNFKSSARQDMEKLGSSDIKIIETSSQPNMLLQNGDGVDSTVEELKSISDPLFNRNKYHTQVKKISNTDCEGRDSFLEIEKSVTEQCNVPHNCDTNLDNTLEFVDFILNHAQSHVGKKNVLPSSITNIESSGDDCKSKEAPQNKVLCQSTTNNKVTSKEQQINTNKSTYVTNKTLCDQTETLLKLNQPKPEVGSVLNTPIVNRKEVSNIFKTPKIPQSLRKDTPAKKTPNRLKAYEHIASPVATYIRNSPQVPLVRDVHPKKPLPSTSLIPKLLKNNLESKSDKENIVLPPLAYRNAKKTLVIDVNKEKLPQSQWAQKLTTIPRKPVVIKHNYRETGIKPLSLQQEDSFQDLTLHQAEVSVCTEKLAFNKL